MVEGISDPRVMALPVEMRNRALFDNSLRVQGIGNILVLDPAGNVVIDSEYPLPRKANFADRDYFKVFEGGAHTGLYVGAPVRARLSGLNSLPVSRAFYDSDGRLAGVVVGTIRLAHFQGLFEELNLGAGGALNLFRADGVLVTRFPFSEDVLGRSLAGTPTMRNMQAARSGTFTGRAALDKVERLYAFRHVGDYPLMVNVAQSVDSIFGRLVPQRLAFRQLCPGADGRLRGAGGAFCARVGPPPGGGRPAAAGRARPAHHPEQPAVHDWLLRSRPAQPLCQPRLCGMVWQGARRNARQAYPRAAG